MARVQLVLLALRLRFARFTTARKSAFGHRVHCDHLGSLHIR